MSIVTDSKGVEDAKDPDTCNVFALLKLMAPAEEVAEWRQRYQGGGMGYGDAKKRWRSCMRSSSAHDGRFGPTGPPGRMTLRIYSAKGAAGPRVAAEVMADVRQACGLLTAAPADTTAKDEPGMAETEAQNLIAPGRSGAGVAVGWVSRRY